MSTVNDMVKQRFKTLCAERGIALNALANLSGITPSTVYSMFSSKQKHTSITTIKILCDGLDITLGEFFNAPEFDDLEQEIK